MLLALDTCLDACAAALAADGVLLASRTQDMRRGHAEALLPMIASLLEETGRTAGEISRIAVTVGPGSFTGVRVGVAAARGLALALGVPAAGFSTLEALAAAARERAGDIPVLAAIAARGDRLFVQAFDPAGTPLQTPALVTAAQAGGRFAAHEGILTGSGAALLCDRIANGEPVPSPSGLAAALVTLAAAGQGMQPPAPLYLGPPDAVRPVGAALPRRHMK